MGKIVEMHRGTQTVLNNPRDGSVKRFNFDHSFWTFDEVRSRAA